MNIVKTILDTILNDTHIYPKIEEKPNDEQN